MDSVGAIDGFSEGASEILGLDDGLTDGTSLGFLLGSMELVGAIDGFSEGASEILGLDDGLTDGTSLGFLLGSMELVGAIDGFSDGASEILGTVEGYSDPVGRPEGAVVGTAEIVGYNDGFEDGASEGSCERLGVKLGAMDAEGLVVCMTALALAVVFMKNGRIIATRPANPTTKEIILMDFDLEAAASCSTNFFFVAAALSIVTSLDPSGSSSEPFPMLSPAKLEDSHAVELSAPSFNSTVSSVAGSTAS
mmetsp:Transcript_2544/g.6090  ORF Transcript_2544/g.6090 Transcript_2544/m.6090 type:complete len:251 (-) Transcript_2544:1820-2572(-)